MMDFISYYSGASVLRIMDDMDMMDGVAWTADRLEHLNKTTIACRAHRMMKIAFKVPLTPTLSLEGERGLTFGVTTGDTKSGRFATIVFGRRGARSNVPLRAPSIRFSFFRCVRQVMGVLFLR
jgi:hypothetical protein